MQSHTLSPEQQQDLDDLVFTLQIAERSLPMNANSVHVERLRRIQLMLECHFLNPPPPAPQREPISLSSLLA